ncbi:2-hydroxyacid dehydrogenase [Maricurvus nonylphenolicus]|uniref:D-2-hydroxyacid dehydrogenase n=1 Tax=Maricurvus nonylphenolicus TaxID=1008307 RepID=UPI0036F2686A
MRGVILDSDTLAPADLDLQSLYNSLDNSLDDWQTYATTQPEQTLARIQGAEVVVTNKVVIDRQMLEQSPSLKLICIAATGTNNVDLQAAADYKVTVTNVAGYGVGSVAQHTLALMLALATKLPQYHNACQSGQWSQSPFFCMLDHPIIELADKTLGIVGYGAIGQAVAKLAEAIGMRVIISARPGSHECPSDRLPLAEVLSQADILSLHCPLTPATDQFINHHTLQQLKPGSLLINTARGGLIDEAALVAALKSGQLGGAALDSISVEPPPADHPLLAADIPNLILTPHCAWGSQKARQTLVNEVALNIQAFRRGEARNLVRAD